MNNNTVTVYWKVSTYKITTATGTFMCTLLTFNWCWTNKMCCACTQNVVRTLNIS